MAGGGVGGWVEPGGLAGPPPGSAAEDGLRGVWEACPAGTCGSSTSSTCWAHGSEGLLGAPGAPATAILPGPVFQRSRKKAAALARRQPHDGKPLTGGGGAGPKAGNTPGNKEELPTHGLNQPQTTTVRQNTALYWIYSLATETAGTASDTSSPEAVYREVFHAGLTRPHAGWAGVVGGRGRTLLQTRSHRSSAIHSPE